MIKTKVALLEGRLLSSQSEQFEKISKSSDLLEKIRPSKKATCFDYVNRLNVCKGISQLHDQIFTTKGFTDLRNFT